MTQSRKTQANRKKSYNKTKKFHAQTYVFLTSGIESSLKCLRGETYCANYF